MEPDGGQIPEKLFTPGIVVLIVVAVLPVLAMLALPALKAWHEHRGPAYGSPGDTHSALSQRGFTEECQQLRNGTYGLLETVQEALGPYSTASEAEQRHASRLLRSIASEPLAREYERWAREYGTGTADWRSPTKGEIIGEFEGKIWDEHDCSHYPPDEPSPQSP